VRPAALISGVFPIIFSLAIVILFSEKRQKPPFPEAFV
jgi:hypothetical protein